MGRGGEPQLARRQDGTLVTIAFDPHRPAILVWDKALQTNGAGWRVDDALLTR